MRFPRAKHKQYAIIYNDELVSAIFKKRFLKKFVGNLIEMPNGQVPDEVYRGNCNIGLHYVTSSQYEASIQKFRSMGIVFTTLVNEPLYAVLNTKSPLSKLDKIYLEQLHGMNFLAEYIKISGKRNPLKTIPCPMFSSGNRVVLCLTTTVVCCIILQ